MSFEYRSVRLTFNLAEGNFGGKGNSVTLQGLRTKVFISKGGSSTQGSCEIEVYGLTNSQLNQLSTLGLIYSERKRNTVIVEAGDENGAYSTVFTGTITEGMADFSNQPEVIYVCQALEGAIEKSFTSDPLSYDGYVKVSDIMSSIASKMGKGFENNGVDTRLQNPYFPGTSWDQAASCARAANINWTLDNGTLAIWPMNGSRGNDNFDISPENGLVNYPIYNSQGIIIRVLFDPAIRFGQKINLKSSLKPASGVWTIYYLDHALEGETPGGQWFTTIQANRYGDASYRQ